MRVLVLVLVALSACLVNRAHASPLFELTGDVTDQGGFSPRAAGASAASSYFNPAFLPNAAAGLTLGVFVLNDQIGISLRGRPGGDIPLSYRGATHANGGVFEQTSVPTPWLREGCKAPACPLSLAAHPRQALGSSPNTRPYQAVGLVVAVIPKRLVLGFYGLIPLSQFTTANSFFVDEREQFFTNSLHPELYSDRLTATSLALGAGWKIVKSLSVGGGVTLSLLNNARAQTFVGNADDISRTLLLSTDVGVKVAFAPHFGLSFDPTDRVHFGATVHTVQRLDISTAFSTFLPDGNKQVAVRTAVHDYMPVRIGLSTRCDLLSDGIDEPSDNHELALTASALLGFWSSYINRQGEHPLSEYPFSNTVSLVLGARHSYGHVRTFIDGTYVPTPVPLQTGRTNYVDNDRISASAGFDYDFTLSDVHFRVGAQGQLHMLLYRTQTKSELGAQRVRDEFPDDAVDNRGRPIEAAAGLQTNNPGWPGFSSSGLLFGFGVNLALLL